MAKSNSGISIIESLVCIVIIGIGFIAIMQLSAFSINSIAEMKNFSDEFKK